MFGPCSMLVEYDEGYEGQGAHHGDHIPGWTALREQETEADIKQDEHSSHQNRDARARTPAVMLNRLTEKAIIVIPADADTTTLTANAPIEGLAVTLKTAKRAAVGKTIPTISRRRSSIMTHLDKNAS